MADNSTLARPYAKAVFQIAFDEGALASWGDALAALADLVSRPEIAALIGHPSLTRADLTEALNQGLAGKLSKEAVSLVDLLVQNGRLAALPSLAEQFDQLRAEAESRVDVEITSAIEVPGAQQDQLAAAIRQRLQREVTIDWSTDPELIGGALIRAGDLIIDGSIRGELSRLKTAVLR